MTGLRVYVRLRDAREYLGLDAATAAAACGIDEAELIALEAGRIEVDELKLQRLARAYGVRSAYFTEPESELQEDAVIVLGRLARELRGHDRDEALRFAAYLRHALED